jgi:VanZ family protein
MFLRYNYKALLWALLILVVCSIPGREFPDVSSWSFRGMDKVVHILLYFVFVILLIKGFQQQYSFTALRTPYFLWSILVAVLYGLLIEIFQATLFVDRSAELNDLLANTAGAVLGTIYSSVFKRRQ